MISPEILRRYPYFTGITEESLKRVAMISEEKTLAAGAVLFRESENATHLFIVTEGELDVQYGLGTGERKTVDTIVAGDLTSWTSMVEPYKITSMGVARTPVRLVAIEAPKLRAMFEEDPRLGYRVMTGIAKAVSSRLQGARVQLAAV